MIAAMPLPGLSAQNLLRWMLFSVLAMGMLSLSAGRGTLAYFTTQVQSNDNTFTAGNLRFNILDSVTTTGQYPSVGSSLSLLNMKPGDVVYAPIQLNNVGNIAAKFGIKYTTTTALASNSNGGTISAPTTTQLMDSGRTATNGLAYGALANNYVLITAGAGAPAINKIASVTAPNILVVNTAWTTSPDATTVFSVVKFAGTVGGGATTTTITDAGAPAWTVNQWAGYTASAGANTSKIISNTATTLTVSPAFAGVPSGTYTISPTNLAPALKLGIVGKGTGTAAASPPLTGAGGTACNAANYASAAVFAEQAAGTTSPARVLAAMVAAGETVSAVSATTGTSLAASTGVDVLCMQVSWTDGGAPLSLTTEDNAYNGATPGAYSTNINFFFDGQ
jgi:predicted ribosomally synthesized peptide with SipW-like signal peptide